MQTLHLELGPGGHPREAHDWVYAWVVDGRLAHLGCTWMHPAARAEMHLHQPTDDERSLALRAAVEAAGARATVLGFPVPRGGDRQAHKAALRAVCAACGWLATEPGASTEGVDETWVAEAVAGIALELGA